MMASLVLSRLVLLPCCLITASVLMAAMMMPPVQVVMCTRVVCSIPLSQLKKGAVDFDPPLSALKVAALQRVHMGNIIKVWAVFSRRFWPEDMWDVICTHRLFPEFWMCRYAHEGSTPAESGPELHCVTAFVCGSRASVLGQHSFEDMVQLLVKQLDEVLGSSGEPAPATAAFVCGAAVDWSKEKFIEGGYSSPSLGARVGDRSLLAAPEGGMLFFAGEHTHPDINPCLHAAMDTGDRVAAQVLLARASHQMASRL
jgi:monoamine oxidase